MEIDENLIRRALTVLEQAEHLLRRSELLDALGARAKAGDNQHTRTGGAVTAPPVTTAAIAASVGMSERTAQERTQIARALPEDVRDQLRPTKFADDRYTLLDLAQTGSVHEQRAMTKLLVDGSASSTHHALRLMRQRYRPCPACGNGITDRQRHCDGCGLHQPRSDAVCGNCGRPLVVTPPATTPALPSRPTATVPSSRSADILGELPAPFTRRGGHRDRDTRIDLPVPDDGSGDRPKASDLASRFADLVDDLTKLDGEALARESHSPVVRMAAKSDRQ